MPLVGVALGGVLTGITSYIKDLKERKRVIANALSDLLEVRHRLVVVELTLKTGLAAELTFDQISQLRTLLTSLLPGDPKLDERYESSISLLAGFDPVLAFRMRSRNDIGKTFTAIRDIGSNNGISPAHIESLEQLLQGVAIPNLNQAVLQLARSHSWRTLRRVKEVVEKSESLPPETFGILEALPKWSATVDANH